MILTNPMYLASDSPFTQITEAISGNETEIKVFDSTAFPPAPNFATLGTETGAEVVFYGEIDTPNHTLKQVVRGRSFTIAHPWGVGTDIYHSWTAENHNAIVKNILTLGDNATAVGDPALVARLSSTGAVSWDSGNLNPDKKMDKEIKANVVVTTQNVATEIYRQHVNRLAFSGLLIIACRVVAEVYTEVFVISARAGEIKGLTKLGSSFPTAAHITINATTSNVVVTDNYDIKIMATGRGGSIATEFFGIQSDS